MPEPQIFEQVVMVIGAESDEEVQASIEDFTSRVDDARWLHVLARPFTWQGFTEWWAARRWVRPRDVRKG